MTRVRDPWGRHARRRRRAARPRRWAAVALTWWRSPTWREIHNPWVPAPSAPWERTRCGRWLLSHLQIPPDPWERARQIRRRPQTQGSRVLGLLACAAASLAVLLWPADPPRLRPVPSDPSAALDGVAPPPVPPAAPPLEFSR